MQTNEHVDLATWLTAVWDEEERRAQMAPMPIYREVHDSCIDPASVLARIAADRKILALHSYHMTSSLDSYFKQIPGTERRHCDTCASQDENGEWWPCETVRLLASPYAGREGFRPEWLVERQGVEQ